MAAREFEKWSLVREGQTTGKTGLYPLSYLGIYPPQVFITRSADALYYMSQDDRFYLGREGPPNSILHIPGRPSSKVSGRGEGPPHPITHIPGRPSVAGLAKGEGSPFKITHLEGFREWLVNEAAMPPGA